MMLQCSIEVWSTPNQGNFKTTIYDRRLGWVWWPRWGHVTLIQRSAAEAQQIKDAPPLAATGLDCAVAAHGVWKRLGQGRDFHFGQTSDYWQSTFHTLSCVSGCTSKGFDRIVCEQTMLSMRTSAILHCHLACCAWTACKMSSAIALGAVTSGDVDLRSLIVPLRSAKFWKGILNFWVSMHHKNEFSEMLALMMLTNTHQNSCKIPTSKCDVVMVWPPNQLETSSI